MGFIKNVALVLALASATMSQTTLTVSTSGGNSTNIGTSLMFEDINNSGDGGIYGNLLKNNGFQPGVDVTLDAYAAVGGSDISADGTAPLSKAIKYTLKVQNPASNSGIVGYSNSGYLGVPINTDTYRTSIWIKGTFSGPMTISLVDGSGKVHGSSTINVDTTSSKFVYYHTPINAQVSQAADNVWQITYDASLAKDGFMNFGLPQLFPTTFHNRENGIRKDIGDFMQAIGAGYLRWPGGNNLEGNSIADRWKWNETIGPLVDRPGRYGTWGYPNIDGLGLMEYAQWTEDMGLENLLAIWAGHALDGENVSGDALDPYVDDALNELEFMLGEASTQYGALRASFGREQPYIVKMVEIGNEDNLSGGCATYPDRFTQFYNAIHAAYPDMIIVASTTDASCLPNPMPEGAWTDVHYYLEPNQFVSMFNEFDNYPRDKPIIIGEFASTHDNQGQQTYWTDMIGSTGEAVYMIGMERNSDVVKGYSYAPILEHFNLAEWSPDLFGLDSSAGSLTGSTSYYVNQLFGQNRGSSTKPVTSNSAFGPLYWVASADDSSYFVKLANYGTSTESVTIKVPGASFGTAELQLLAGNPTTSNYPHQVSTQTVSSVVNGSAEDGYTFEMPQYSVAVLVMKNA